MQAVRHLLSQRRLAALICAAALLLKLLVPAGYMVDRDRRGITIAICSGSGPATMTMMPQGVHDVMPDHGGTKDHGKAEQPCAFSGLSAAMLGAIDPVQLAALIAFVLTLGLVVTPAPPTIRPPYLRPPLRGPPAYL